MENSFLSSLLNHSETAASLNKKAPSPYKIDGEGAFFLDIFLPNYLILGLLRFDFPPRIAIPPPIRLAVFSWPLFWTAISSCLI